MVRICQSCKKKKKINEKYIESTGDSTVGRDQNIRDANQRMKVNQQKKKLAQKKEKNKKTKTVIFLDETKRDDNLLIFFTSTFDYIRGLFSSSISTSSFPSSFSFSSFVFSSAVNFLNDFQKRGRALRADALQSSTSGGR